MSPTALPQVPPTVFTVWLVLYGNVRCVPLTVVTAGVGGVVSMLIVCAPVEPALPATSPWVTVTAYEPAADSAGDGLKVHAPPEVQEAVPFWVEPPVTAIETVLLSPAPLPQVPPTSVTE